MSASLTPGFTSGKTSCMILSLVLVCEMGRISVGEAIESVICRESWSRATTLATSLPAEHDLAEGLIRVHQLVRRPDLSERQHPIDNRPQLSRIE